MKDLFYTYEKLRKNLKTIIKIFILLTNIKKLIFEFDLFIITKDRQPEKLGYTIRTPGLMVPSIGIITWFSIGISTTTNPKFFVPSL